MGIGNFISAKFRIAKSELAALLFRTGVIKQKPNESYIDHNADYASILAMSRDDRLKEVRRREAERVNYFDDPIVKMNLLLEKNPKLRDTVIDIGSGLGLNSIKLSKKFKQVIALEPSEAAVSIAKEVYPAKDYPNIDWRVGFAEVELDKTKLDKPALLFTNVVLSHIDDKTVSTICASISKVAPKGSVLNIVEAWGKESHQRVWHVRTQDWWRARFPDWELWFHGPVIQDRKDRNIGIHGVKIR